MSERVADPQTVAKSGEAWYTDANDGEVRAVTELDMRRWLPGLLALLTVTALLLGAAAGAKPIPDDPEPVVLPPLVENPYGPEDFVPDERGYLTCIAGESVLGIDVSEFQEVTDWAQVKAAGVEFVMIRVGYRGYGTGAIRGDSSAAEHYAGARAAGLKVGAYFFSQAVTVEEAVEEARFLLQAVEHWDVEMPLVFDWEYMGSDTRTGEMDPELLTECTRAFCRVIRRAGYRPMVYFNITQSRELLYLEELTDFDWWLARYADSMDFEYRVQMWQYTDRGNVPGITGEVDLNLWFPEE